MPGIAAMPVAVCGLPVAVRAMPVAVCALPVAGRAACATEAASKRYRS
jgi:hypothetical protein